jgi:LysM repeat protein
MAALLGIAHAQEGLADTVGYRVRQGDTLELIAAEYYGDRNKAVFIMVENKIVHARPLRPGERLRVPVTREVATGPGDTFESLAGAHLGSTRRGAFLAEFNGMAPSDSLPAGTVITLPFTVVHIAATTESLAEVAKAYFGDGRNAELLRRYNFLEKSTLDKNEQLIVPVHHVRMSPAKMPPLDAESKARRDHRRTALAKVAKALAMAHQAWKAGDFEGVKATLIPLEADLDFLDARDAVDVTMLLGAAHVAFDNTEAATASFKRALDRQPNYTLQRYDASPKVLAVWQKAGGHVEP